MHVLSKQAMGKQRLLGEAVQLRADLLKRQGLLKTRIIRSLMVQEDEREPENVKGLLKRLRAEGEELAKLDAAVNHTNESVKVQTDEGEVTISEAVTQREYLQSMIRLFRYVARNSRPSDPYSHTEVRRVAVLDASEYESKADEYQERVHKLMVALQNVDWTVHVIDYDLNDQSDLSVMDPVQP